MKRKISSVIALCITAGMFSNLAFAANVNIPDEPAVILSGNMKAHSTGSIIGSVYSADGDINFGGGIKIIDGDLVYNKNNSFNTVKWDEGEIKGAVKSVDETSFGYSVSDADVETGNISVFDGRDYDVKQYMTVASWVNGGLTINSDTYFEGSLTLFEPLTVDTSKGDVYVKIDSLNMQNSSGTQNNGIINVVGDGKLYLLVNSAWGGDTVMFVNAGIAYNGSERTVTAGDSSKVDLYINANGKTAGIGSQSVVCANVYMVNEKADSEWSPVRIQGEIYGDVYVSADYVSITTDGSTSVKGDVYLLNTKKLSISNDITGNVVTDAETVVITGGDAKVLGVVFAPTSDVTMTATRNHSDDDADIIGQLVADTLEMTGSAKIMYSEKAVEDFGVTSDNIAKPTQTPQVTAEPTAEPTQTPQVTAEPTAEPTQTPQVTTEPTAEPTNAPESDGKDENKSFDLIPDNDIPQGPQKRLKSDSAYLYGYNDQWVGADMSITREEVCALINRLLVQNNAREDFEKPNNQSFADVSADHWSYSALEYMRYIEVYNTDDGTGELRNISPDTPVTRGEVAKIVAFSLRLPYIDGDLDFDDVSKDHKFYKYMKAMVDAGLWQGDNGMLRPDNEMTRAEFVTMFNRIIGRTEENGYVVTAEDCPFIYNKDDDDLFLPLGTVDENGNEIGHWAYYEITRAACSFTKKKVDPDKKSDRGWLDQQ